MQEPFGGETFSYSLFLVLCNRICTCSVALFMLLVRRAVGHCTVYVLLLLASQPPPLQLPRAVSCCHICPASHAGLTTGQWPGLAASGSPIQLCRSQRVQCGGNLLPVRAQEEACWCCRCCSAAALGLLRCCCMLAFRMRTTASHTTLRAVTGMRR